MKLGICFSASLYLRNKVFSTSSLSLYYSIDKNIFELTFICLTSNDTSIDWAYEGASKLVVFYGIESIYLRSMVKTPSLKFFVKCLHVKPHILLRLTVSVTFSLLSGRQ